MALISWQQVRAMAERSGSAVGASTGRAGLDERLALARQHHQAGRLAEAEPLYRQILAIDPRHHESLHLLGVVAGQSGHGEAAIGLIGQAIALRGDVAAYHYNLALLLQQSGRTDAAAGHFDQAVVLQPDHADAHNAAAVIRLLQGRFDAAVASFERVLALRPDHAEATCNLGVALQQSGRPEAAAAALAHALTLRPDYPEAADNLGNVLHGLGVSFQQQGRLDEAALVFECAVALRPDATDSARGLAEILRRPRQSHAATPAVAGEVAAMLAAVDRVLAQQPDHAETALTQALLRLLTGHFQVGWPRYEARWRTRHFAASWRHFDVPRWDGAAGAGGTLLLWAEQGLGDSLQFCRYATLAAERGWQVVVEVPTALVRLLQGLAGATVVPIGGAAALKIDRHCPLLSLPLVFGTTLDTIPAGTPYLAAVPEDVALWQQRLAGSPDAAPGLKVGLAWGGNPAQDPSVHAVDDSRRSIALDRLAPLLAVPGVGFVSLMKDRRAGVEMAAYGMLDVMDKVEDFADTAAIIAQLDLVITVDTSIVHLAGALGKPVWLLNRFDTCWRWLLDRDDSPWYPTLRQFRQPERGDWDSVIAAAAAALTALAAMRS
jgi:tetratricopeptide (TPR) repeat protein